MLETSCWVKDEQQESVIRLFVTFPNIYRYTAIVFQFGYNLAKFIATAQCIPAQQYFFIITKIQIFSNYRSCIVMYDVWPPSTVT